MAANTCLMASTSGRMEGRGSTGSAPGSWRWLAPARQRSCHRAHVRPWLLPRCAGWRGVWTCRAASEATGAPALLEWDVVLYQASDGCTAVGRVSELQAQSARIERLEEEGEGLWAVTDRVDEVALAGISQVLQADYMQLCDADRVSNPHGEHAHEAFRIADLLPPGIWGAAAAAQRE